MPSEPLRHKQQVNSSAHTKHVSQRAEKKRRRSDGKHNGNALERFRPDSCFFLAPLVLYASFACKVHNFPSRNNEKIHQKIKRGRAGPREAPLIVGWWMP